MSELSYHRAPVCTRHAFLSLRALTTSALIWAILAGSGLPAQTPPPAAPAPPSLDALFQEGANAYNSGNFTRTISIFNDILKQAKPGPALEPVYFTLAYAKLRLGDNEGAILGFRQYLQLYPTGAQINDARAGLTRALLAAKRMPEALAAITSLRDLRNTGGSQGVDDSVALIGLTLEIADSLLDAKQPAEALELLQTALNRDQVIENQLRRIADLERLFAQAQATAGSFGLGSNLVANREALASRLKEAREALKRAQENPAFDLPRLLRQGRCHNELNQPWEAIVIYQEILKRFPDAPDRAYALHGLIYSKQVVNRLAEAQELSQRFLTEFPNHPLVAEVAALGGQISTQLNDNTRASSFFGSAIEKSQGSLQERVIFQLGSARFSLRDWTGAREMFDRYARDYTTGEWVENARYRSAVSWFLDGADPDRYAKAEKAIKAFIEKSPASTYLPDAYYRLAICQFAHQEYDQAVVACDDWEKRYPNDGLLPEVLSLRGDVLKALGRNDDALETYLRAASAASSDDVLSYTLNEAGRLLEQKKDWTRLASVFSTQLERQPDSKLALGWLYWVARAKARAGQPDEAWSFLAARLGSEMANPEHEDVEKILVLMAQIKARQRPASGEPSPASPADQLIGQLKLPGAPDPVTQARVRYYEAKVLTLTRKPDEAQKIMLNVGRELPSDQLSAPLLAEAGEALFKKGNVELAAVFFNALLTRFPRSEYRDYAYVGLGNLALDQGEPDAALRFFNDAIDKAGAEHRLREATVGQARSQFALRNYKEATALFERIAAAKEWRGEATALSLYYLGEIAVKEGDLPKGINFFQRVFVSQRRYTEWVAKAYLASGQAFENLGKPSEAAATYREMIRNERIKDRPELTPARARLKALDPAST